MMLNKIFFTWNALFLVASFIMFGFSLCSGGNNSKERNTANNSDKIPIRFEHAEQDLLDNITNWENGTTKITENIRIVYWISKKKDDSIITGECWLQEPIPVENAVVKMRISRYRKDYPIDLRIAVLLDTDEWLYLQTSSRLAIRSSAANRTWSYWPGNHYLSVPSEGTKTIRLSLSDFLLPTDTYGTIPLTGQLRALRIQLSDAEQSRLRIPGKEIGLNFHELSVIRTAIWYPRVWNAAMRGEIVHRYIESHHSWIEDYKMLYNWGASFKTVFGYAYFYHYTGDEHYKNRILDYIDNCLLGGPHPLYNASDNWFHSVYDQRTKKFDFWEEAVWADAEGRKYPVPFIQAEGIQMLLTGYLISGKTRYLDIAQKVANHTIVERESLCSSGGSWAEIPLALVMLYKVTENKKYLDAAIFMEKDYLPKCVAKNGLFLNREWMGFFYMTPALMVAKEANDNELKLKLKQWLDNAAPKELAYYRSKIKELAVYEIAHSIMAFTTAASVFPEERDKYLTLADDCWRLVLDNNKFYAGFYDWPESTDAFLTAHIWGEYLSGTMPGKN